MAEAEARTGHVLSFGSFELSPGERLLTKHGAPVDLGARTLDTLIALASRPNEVIGKRELMTHVWPDATVEEGSLRFHIASLRKVLGEGKDGARYIATLAGRGYCFVAPVVRSGGRGARHSAMTADVPRTTFLPSRLARMVGREESVRAVSAELAASRFVTIVGTGGIGKTTVAAAAAHALLDEFHGAVLFVDLGVLSNSRMVAASVASMLGISVQSDDPLPDLIAHVRDKRMLVILDSCEHVVEAAARLAEHAFLAAPQLHILATSREALRVEGEHVHRLMPLPVPPDDPALTAAAALTFPATQLFMERTAASGVRFALQDHEARIVASICRKLDGVPLAIELAAGRVEAYGLQQTAALLDQRLSLLWPGQRTAPPRQKTLQATLDWSYQLLSEPERVVFQRLAVFVGHFTIDAALAVVTSETVDETHVFGAIDSLVAKSMIAVRPVGAMMRYQLLDTARTYALEVSVDDAERMALAARHAAYWRRWLDQTEAGWPTLWDTTERASYLVGLNNVRAALEWCFGPNGDAECGVGLAAAATPAFLALSLLTDCQRWAERAIRSLDDAPHAGPEAMHLQATLGVSLMFTRGGMDAARTALNRSFAIAEERGDALGQLQVLGPLQMVYLRTRNFNAALRCAQHCSVIAGTVEDPGAASLAHSLMGISLHLCGELDCARAELEAALRHGPRSQRTTRVFLGFEGKDLAGALLARTLWLQGHSGQAVERARLTVKEAAAIDHPLTLSVALVWAVSVFLWASDLESADEHIDWLISRAETHSLGPYLAVGRAFKGALAIRRGDAIDGVEILLDSLKELHAVPYELLTTPLNISLVLGLAATDRLGEALTLINETIQLVETNGDLCYMPELLRVKSNLLLAAPQPAMDQAEVHFRQSLELSRRQGARAWELRTAIDLAGLLAVRGQPEAGRAVLQPVVDQFVAGSGTPDLTTAERLLVTMG
jgi:predicted ATPase/DNA-binding winged helix-turn-helix (wHTH) protein